MSKQLFNWYESIVLRHPILSLLAVSLVAAGLALGLPNFKLDASAESLTLEHDTDLDYFREVNKRYGSGDFLLVTFKPHSGELFSDDTLQVLDELRGQLETLEGVQSVTSILDVPLLFSPNITVSQLSDAPRTLRTEGVDRALAKQEFLQSPIYRDLILSPDGKTTAILATLGNDDKYVELVRARDELKLKKERIGLIPAEADELDRVSKEFRAYHTLRTERE
ncbi:MAG: RND family transporter, partial [Porticoccaceae bacterium]|nr:RND family transporter [Porticoccaceae bacterium]